MEDEARLETLKKAAAAAPEAGNVAIAVRDLRWLVELAEQANQESANTPEPQPWHLEDDEQGTSQNTD